MKSLRGNFLSFRYEESLKWTTFLGL